MIRLGAQRLLQELLEAKQREFLGVGRHERSGSRQGQRNGCESAHLGTAERRIQLEAPQVRETSQPFQSKLLGFLKGSTEIVDRLATEMYAHGLSTRDIEAAFTDATGRSILGKSAVSEVTERLWQEYQAFRQQQLDEVEVVYLFADGLYEPMRTVGNEHEALFSLWAICGDGCERLLDITLGSKESLGAWLECLRGLVARGLQAPVLTTSDGAPGLTAALEQLFPEPLRQRCLAHKVRNIIQKVSPADQAAVKAHVQAAYYASRPETARLVAEEVVKKWKATYPSAMASFMGNFEACIAYLRCPQPPQVHPDDPPGREEHRGGAAPHEDAALALQ